MEIDESDNSSNKKNIDEGIDKKTYIPKPQNNLSREKRDIYYQLAKEEGYRARSAFKLLQLDETFHLLDDISYCVDLCAAPGSWSQVLSKKVYKNNPITTNTIVAVDLAPMAPLPGVTCIRGDITQKKTAEDVIAALHGNLAEICVCDGAPDVTGCHDLDLSLQTGLVRSALLMCSRVLKNNGSFVCKVFRGEDTVSQILSLALTMFSMATIAKPDSSRASSAETFLVCKGFKRDSQSVVMWSQLSNEEEDKNTENLVSFFQCGDLSHFDSDASYPVGTAKKYCDLQENQ